MSWCPPERSWWRSQGGRRELTWWGKAEETLVITMSYPRFYKDYRGSYPGCHLTRGDSPIRPWGLLDTLMFGHASSHLFVTFSC